LISEPNFNGDKEFVARLIAGDQEAFKDLVLSYQNKVFNVCIGFLKNAEDAEDMAQEVFIEVFYSISKFKEQANLGTWIYRIAVNKSLEKLRHSKRQKRFAWITSLFGNEERIGESHGNFCHPGVQLENAERSKILFLAIDKLPDNQKTAFLMNKVEGLSYSEICDIMNLSLSAIESLLHRAKKNLQGSLKQYYETHF
jgi:RNA polymerase sigma factor (sigma-70 family)